MEIREALYRARRLLSKIGTFELEPEILLEHLLEMDRAGLYASLYDELSKEEEDGFFDLVERRRACEPIAYLVGEKEFMGLSFKVTRDVLIPRPETEDLVETGISLASRMNRPTIIDLGTGSGAIAISMARYLKNGPNLFAIDYSYPALKIAKLNAERLQTRVLFLCSDLLHGLKIKADLIISNPPYVERENLFSGEPQMALDGGIDGLSFYPRIFSSAYPLLSKNGFLIMEMGAGQSKAIIGIAKRYGFSVLRVIKDLAGIERVLVTERISNIKYITHLQQFMQDTIIYPNEDNTGQR